MPIRESYHYDFKKMNIEQFETRHAKRKTRATSLEEERISKLVNAGDLNYLMQLGNSPDYHEMVEYCLELKRGSFKSCKKSKRLYDRLQLLFMLDREEFRYSHTHRLILMCVTETEGFEYAILILERKRIAVG